MMRTFHRTHNQKTCYFGLTHMPSMGHNGPSCSLLIPTHIYGTDSYVICGIILLPAMIPPIPPDCYIYYLRTAPLYLAIPTYDNTCNMPLRAHAQPTFWRHVGPTQHFADIGLSGRQKLATCLCRHVADIADMSSRHDMSAILGGQPTRHDTDISN